MKLIVYRHREILSNRNAIFSLCETSCEAQRHCLHGRGFICNRIGFDAVTPFRLHGAGRVRYQNRVVLNTLSKVERFQNDTVSLVV